MTQQNPATRNFRKLGYGAALLATLVLIAVTLALAAEKREVETIDAIAMGTSTQLGKTVSVKIHIYDYSSDADREILIDAYKKGQNQGLVNALTKMEVGWSHRHHRHHRL